MDAEPLTPSTVAVTETVPGVAAAVTTPTGDTVAIAALDEDHDSGKPATTSPLCSAPRFVRHQMT
jgi:hypothetical protein